MVAAPINLTSYYQWYAQQNFLDIKYYKIVTNVEKWLDNNRYDSVNNKWVGLDSVRLNLLETEGKKKKEINKQKYLKNKYYE